MDKKQIAIKLRAILCRDDVEIDGLINRKKSKKHNDDLEVLLDHVSILVSYLKFEVDATRSELFQVRNCLEE